MKVGKKENLSDLKTSKPTVLRWVAERYRDLSEKERKTLIEDESRSGTASTRDS